MVKHTTGTGDPTSVYQITAWEVHGAHLSTALLKVSYAILEHKPINFYKFKKSIKPSCHGLFLLILSEWKLEPAVDMATMQRDVWRGTQDTCSHML